jgi:hypothetical protein
MIVTLAFGLLLHAVMNNWDAVTRGAAGFAGIPRPKPIAWGDTVIAFGQLPNFYYLALALTALVFALQYLVVRSNLGRILGAIRQDERLARSRGVNVLMYKTVVFSLGTALAGLGGVLHVSFLRVAAPASFTMLESINTVLEALLEGGRPAVFNHNVETVPRLYARVRPKARYERSLSVLRTVATELPGMVVKSGLMVGLGETVDEVKALLDDLRANGVRVVTIGQYLRPSLVQVPVVEYLTEAAYGVYVEHGQRLGFDHVFAGPFVRSSYNAAEALRHARAAEVGR